MTLRYEDICNAKNIKFVPGQLWLVDSYKVLDDKNKKDISYFIIVSVDQPIDVRSDDPWYWGQKVEVVITYIVSRDVAYREWPMTIESIEECFETHELIWSPE